MSILSIPIRNNDSEWSRLELEKWLRTNVFIKGHAVLIKVACVYGLDPIYAQNVCSNVLIHWLLDKIIVDSPKSAEAIKCGGERMGLVGMLSKKDAVPRTWKIKGIDDPRGNLEEFMKDYHEKLAHFLAHNWAVRPDEVEGVDLDVLDRLMGTSTPSWTAPLPAVPSDVPKLSVVKIADPSTTRKVKRVVDIQDIQNLQAEIDKGKEESMKINARMDGHENRIAMLELKVRG